METMNRWKEDQQVEILVNGEKITIQAVVDVGHLVQTGFVVIQGITLTGGMAVGENLEQSIGLLGEVFSEAVNTRRSVEDNLASVVAM